MKKTLLSLAIGLTIIPLAIIFLDFSISAVQLNVLATVAKFYLGTAVACFIISQLANNYSQVDKLWSIIPVAFTWVMAWEGNFQPRLLLMAGLATVWGIRLTYNFSRRGGYSWRFWEGDEDYRWEVLRKNPLLDGPVRWGIFNLTFISFYQLGLLLLITLPMIVVMQDAAAPIGLTDLLVSMLFLGLVAFETIADQQQWVFQNEKHALLKEGKPLIGKFRKGFIAERLWSISRHPNYFAEQSIWVTFYLFSVIATGSLLNWSIVGCLLLILLFQGSANFSEGITAGKYPDYKRYQSTTPKFFPRLWKGREVEGARVSQSA